jgi:hypothetical protein
MKTRNAIKRSIYFVVLAVAAGALLSGCASAGPNGPGDCVGPPSYCNIFFGS